VLAGLGGGTAHGIFAALASTGAGAVDTIIAEHHQAVRLGSALVLLALGIRVLRKRPADRPAGQGSGLRAAYLSTLMLGLTNPLTLVPYVAAVPTFAATALAQPGAAVLLTIGAASAATLWYLTIGCLATLVPRGLVTRLLPRLNLLAGTAQIGFALVIYLR
jgi:threonine/homoserine/homoserine lactone efflux protein